MSQTATAAADIIDDINIFNVCMPIGDNADKLVMKVTLNTTDSIFPYMLSRDLINKKASWRSYALFYVRSAIRLK